MANVSRKTQDRPLFLGFDIGGSKSAVTLGTRDGQLLAKEQFPTRELKGPQQTIDGLIEQARKVLGRHSGKLIASGIACGSPMDQEHGIIQSPPNLPSWINVPIVQLIRNETKVPTFLENDANAGAIAEHSFGAGVGAKNIVFLTFGTGLGAGIIINDQIYRGANGNAGELGHIRLQRSGPFGYFKRGSFEGFCSGGGIKQLIASMRIKSPKKTILPPNASAKDVAMAAQKGDELAIKVLEKSGHELGRGLSLIVDILNPERIIIGSIFLRCESFLRPAMEKALRKEALPQALAACKILPAGLGESVGDFAALSVGFAAMNARKARK